MFTHLTFVLVGVWQGSASLILLVLGILLITMPYLVQPVFGCKFRSILGSIIFILGLIGIVNVVLFAHQEISDTKYQQLSFLANKSHAANAINNLHTKDKYMVTNIEFFELVRGIRQRHPGQKFSEQDAKTDH